MLQLDLITCYIFFGVMALAIALGVIYGLMLYVKLIIDTIKKWRAEDGKGML